MNKIFPCAGRGGDCTGVRDLVRFRLRGRRSQWDQDRRGKDCKEHAWINHQCPITRNGDQMHLWPLHWRMSSWVDELMSCVCIKISRHCDSYSGGQTWEASFNMNGRMDEWMNTVFYHEIFFKASYSMR